MSDYFRQSRDLTNSLLLIIPVLVLYELGLLITRFEVLNGVDFLTIFLLRYFGMKGLLLFNLGLLAVLLVASHLRRKQEAFNSDLLPGVLFESLIYAASLGALISFLMSHFFVPLQAGPQPLGTLPAVVLSLGAGFNEELIFRLVLYGGLLFTFHDFFDLERGPAIVLAAILSSLLFSLAHYGPGGDVFAWTSFTYRTLAGLLFCALYQVRGFAVAVYTHALYDILVLVPATL